jgi:hypothetical protein
VEKERWRRRYGGLVAAAGIRERTRRRLWTTYGASRLPELSDVPPYLLAEGRPNDFLPAMRPKGGNSALARCVWRGAMELSSAQVASSPVPARSLPLRSSFGPDRVSIPLFGVLFAKSMDCYVFSTFLLGLAVSCACMVI